MYIKKLAKMAREENPNPFLAKLSIHWAEQTKLGNPVRDALNLWRWRWFLGISGILFFLYVAVGIVWRPSVLAASGETLFFVGVAIVAPCLLTRLSMWEDRTNDRFDSAKRFTQAITTLENVLERPIEEWTEAHDLQVKAIASLKDKAEVVKVAEGVEARAVERTPWKTPDKAQAAAPHREVFEDSFELLTTLLPLSKDKGTYYGNQTSGKEAVTV